MCTAHVAACALGTQKQPWSGRTSRLLVCNFASLAIRRAGCVRGCQHEPRRPQCCLMLTLERRAGAGTVSVPSSTAHCVAWPRCWLASPKLLAALRGLPLPSAINALLACHSRRGCGLGHGAAGSHCGTGNGARSRMAVGTAAANDALDPSRPAAATAFRPRPALGRPAHERTLLSCAQVRPPRYGIHALFFSAF